MRWLLPCLLVAGCAGTETGNAGDECRYPETVPDEAVYVCPEAEDGDGTRERPLGTLEAGLSAGDVVVVAAGTYSESVAIEGRRHVVAHPDAVLHPPAGEPGIIVRGDLTLHDLRIEGATTAGLWLDGGRAEVAGVRVVGTRPDDRGRFGDGVVASHGADLAMSRSEVHGSAGVGVLVVAAAGTLDGVALADNARGGARFEQAIRAELRAVEAEGNGVAGLALLSTAGTVRDCTFAGTDGDGVVVGDLRGASATADPVSLDGNILRGNRRVGLLVDTAARLTAADNEVAGNAAGGVWLQGDTGRDDPAVLTGNRVLANDLLGIQVVAGARARLVSNRVADTRVGTRIVHLVEVEIGEGIAIVDAEAEAVSNVVEGTGRAGLLLDRARGRVAENHVSGARFGLVLQRTDAVAVEENRFEGNEVDIRRIDVPAEWLPVLDAPLSAPDAPSLRLR